MAGISLPNAVKVFELRRWVSSGCLEKIYNIYSLFVFERKTEDQKIIRKANTSKQKPQGPGELQAGRQHRESPNQRAFRISPLCAKRSTVLVSFHGVSWGSSFFYVSMSLWDIVVSQKNYPKRKLGEHVTWPFHVALKMSAFQQKSCLPMTTGCALPRWPSFSQGEIQQGTRCWKAHIVWSAQKPFQKRGWLLCLGDKP